MYSNGVSEEIVGKAIKKFNIPRNKVLILTKCFGHVAEDVSVRAFFYPEEFRQSKDYVNQAGMSLYTYRWEDYILICAM